MSVVDVREMRVVVSEPRVLMNMGVRLPHVPLKIVGVLMVVVMLVAVRVLQLGVLMLVGMVFCQMKPNTGGHQGC